MERGGIKNFYGWEPSTSLINPNEGLIGWNSDGIWNIQVGTTVGQALGASVG